MSTSGIATCALRASTRDLSRRPSTAGDATGNSASELLVLSLLMNIEHDTIRTLLNVVNIRCRNS
jgi:hypothetical protein